jgi:hypothetical protein
VSANEVWGAKARPDPLVEYFKETFRDRGLVDIVPSAYAPTWRNGRGGSEGIAKILDIFFMSEDLVSLVGRYRTWVAHLYILDHAPIVLQIDDGQCKIAHPFKLNPIWLEEKGLCDIVHTVWNSTEFDGEPSTMRRLVGKLTALKQKVRDWEKVQKRRRHFELVQVEDDLEKLYLTKANGNAWW